ncbi:hypothetical protein ACH5RR_008804 [Cinchona calisaya]|uniref:Uncharacterized protein n=1 Tax=Cinchona calisaya TaxID=153742 RepID=A0ABD3ACN2_9GENT
MEVEADDPHANDSGPRSNQHFLEDLRVPANPSGIMVQDPLEDNKVSTNHKVVNDQALLEEADGVSVLKVTLSVHKDGKKSEHGAEEEDGFYENSRMLSDDHELLNVPEQLPVRDLVFSEPRENSYQGEFQLVL